MRKEHNMALDLSAFKAKKVVKFYNGKEAIEIGSFLDGEIVTVSAIDGDGIRENTDVVFSMDLVNTLQAALENGYRAITIFKK